MVSRLLDLTQRFSVGINLDDSWRYAGVKEPKSIIIPHLLSASLPEGKILDKIDELIIGRHGDSEPTSEAARASLALAENLVDARVDYVRCWFPWVFFEPRPVPEDQLNALLERSYDSWPLDDFVKTLTDRGIGVVPVVACGYQRMLPDGLDVDRTTESYLRRVEVHTRLLVRHYKARIKNWQIENEPNWWRMHEGGGWRRGATWLEHHSFRVDLLGTLNKAVHAEDPGATTIINLEGDAGIAGADSYTPYCDVVGVDFYPNYRASSPVNTSVLRLADGLARECGTPVMISETGYPSGPFLLGYTASKQADYVKRALEESFALEGVNSIGVWRYADSSWRSFPDQENHFGLIDRNGNFKPAWATLGETIGRLKK